MVQGTPLNGAFRESTLQSFLKTKFKERRVRYGKPNSVGDLSHHDQGKGKEREKVNPDGLL
jgi:hypothetical protein